MVPGKIQKIQRATNKTYYVNFLGAVADAINLEKGEEMEWFIFLQQSVNRALKHAPIILFSCEDNRTGTQRSGTRSRTRAEVDRLSVNE
jgi:hypothetical protein